MAKFIVHVEETTVRKGQKVIEAENATEAREIALDEPWVPDEGWEWEDDGDLVGECEVVGVEGAE